MVNPEGPFFLNDVYPGTNDDGDLINAHLLGTVSWFPYAPDPATQHRGSKSRTNAKMIGAICLRNESGIAILGKRFARLTRTAGNSLMTSVNGYGAVLNERLLVLTPPYLPSAGVPDDDIFWGIFQGPSLVLTPNAGAAFNEDIAAGAPLVGATAASTQSTLPGRVSNMTLVGQTGTTDAFNAAIGLLGYALSARTTGETSADLLMHVSIPGLFQ